MCVLTSTLQWLTLILREGQLIKIFGDKDSDGFYWGEAGSKNGFVPCNMVSEVQVDDDHVAEELFKEQSQQQQGVVTATTATSKTNGLGPTAATVIGGTTKAATDR